MKVVYTDTAGNHKEYEVPDNPAMTLASPFDVRDAQLSRIEDKIDLIAEFLFGLIPTEVVKD